MKKNEKMKTINDILQKDEKILWKYKPSILFGWTSAVNKMLFKNNKKKMEDTRTGAIAIAIIIFLFFSLAYNPIKGLQITLSFAIAILPFFLMLYFSTLAIARENKKMYYYITNKRIILLGDYETLTSTIKSIKNIMFDDVSKIFKSGTIEFVLSGKPRMRFEGVPKVTREYSSIRLLIESIQKGTIK